MIYISSERFRDIYDRFADRADLHALTPRESFRLGWGAALEEADDLCDDQKADAYQTGRDNGYVEGRDSLRDDLTHEVERWAESLDYQIPDDMMYLLQSIDVFCDTTLTEHIRKRRPR